MSGDLGYLDSYDPWIHEGNGVFLSVPCTSDVANGAVALSYLLLLPFVIFYGGRVKQTGPQSCWCSQTDGPSSALSRHLAADLLILFRVSGVCSLLMMMMPQTSSNKTFVKHPMTYRWIGAVSFDLSLYKHLLKMQIGSISAKLCIREEAVLVQHFHMAWLMKLFARVWNNFLTRTHTSFAYFLHDRNWTKMCKFQLLRELTPRGMNYTASKPLKCGENQVAKHQHSAGRWNKSAHPGILHDRPPRLESHWHFRQIGGLISHLSHKISEPPSS